MPVFLRSIAATFCIFSAVGCSASVPTPEARTEPTVRTPPRPDVVSSDAPILAESASPITFPRMAKYPEPGWHVPRLIRFSPDGKLVTFLESEAATDEMALFALDLSNGKVARMLRASDLGAARQPSLAEELRNERQRKRITGITEYGWAKKANVMVVPAEGDVFVRGANGSISRLTNTEEPEIDPQICADGSKVAYVRKSEIVAYDLATQKESEVTHGAKPGITRGVSDFNGQEEFDEPSGFLWSPDCKRIAYWEVDEHAVKEVPVMGYRATGTSLMMQRYPLAGETNPTVSLHVVDLATRKSTRVELPDAGEKYFGRLRFSEDSAGLYLQTIGRSQKELDVVRVDVKSGKSRVIFNERPPGWAEMSEMAFARDGKELLLLAENGGHTHLARLEATSGKLLGWATSGDWDVTDFVRYDPADDTAYVIATKDEPIGRQLYRVSLGGGDPKRVTQSHGTHEVTLSEKAGAFADIASAVDSPPVAEIRTLTGELRATIPVTRDTDLDALRIRAPEPFTVELLHGPKLYGHLLKPRDFDPQKHYPLIVMVYGGPGVQTVLDRWSPRLLWQHLADRGFFVMQVDNRGSSGRGPAFAAPIANQMGKVELADQLAALDQILKSHPIDPKRVGIYGHSYGGFMAAAAMLKAPGRFKAAVSGSPVTSFRLYDTGYTERFMGTPKEQEAGYDGTDLTKLADKLEGDLFIIHALMDENVHFENTARLIDALVAAQKPFDLLVFPGERHGYRSPVAKEYAQRRVVAYLTQKLSP